MTGLESLGRLLVLLGVFAFLLGMLFILAPKAPYLGRLPGDIFLHKGNFTLYFPLVHYGTCQCGPYNRPQSCPPHFPRLIPMRTSDFDYHLPEHLIAQTPLEPRDHSRLLVVDTATGDLSHRHFYDIGHFLQPGDLLVLNNSRVLPARLRGRRPGTGGAVEVLLLHREEEGLWKAMVKPGRRLGPGAAFEIDGVSVDVLEDLGDGTRLIRMSDEGVIRDSGEVPLPPYIHTPLADGERYQTVYASAEGSAAAPTAGLHFTTGASGRPETQGNTTCSGHSPRGNRHLQAGPV